MLNLPTLLLACLLVASPAAVLGADKPIRRSDANIERIGATQDAASDPWQPTPFVEEGGRLPTGYRGLEPDKFYEMFKRRVAGLKKGEFETSAEFAQRAGDRDAILEPLNTSDSYAFQIEQIQVKYDADTQTYTFRGNTVSSCTGTYGFKADRNWVTCRVAQVSRATDTYTGTNAYGASLTVERTRGLDLALALPKGSPALTSVFSQDRYQRERYEYFDRVSVPLEKARELRNQTIAVLLVGRISDARIVEGRGVLIKPRIDFPNDIFIMVEAVPFDLKKIVYYVVQTGEILAQRTY